MKIVVLDKPRENPGEIDWTQVEKLGEARIYDDTPQCDIIERIADAEIVFVNKGRITREVIEACPNIKFISVIATGFNKIDLEAAKERGILVSNVPSYGSKAIGQHAVALLLEITNHIAHHDKEVKKLRKSTDLDWCFWDYPMYELEYKTMGIIGLGRIGQTVAKAGWAMGMEVIAYDKFESDEMKALGVKYVSLEELYKRADVISLHCPSTPENLDMINKDSIAKMKDGVIILNNSRGELINENDLAEALKSGKVGGAGLDALKVEPITADNPLLSAPNCFITPHISWAALDCRRRLIKLATENVKAYLEGNPINIVNK
jgi:glycerate dehydrogenase